MEEHPMDLTGKKTIIGWGFRDIWNNQELSAEPKGEADNTYIVFKKIRKMWK